MPSGNHQPIPDHHSGHGHDRRRRRHHRRHDTTVVVNNNYAVANVTAYSAGMSALYAAQLNSQIIAAQLMTIGGLVAPVYPVVAAAAAYPVLPPVIPPLAPFGPIAPVRPYAPYRFGY